MAKIIVIEDDEEFRELLVDELRDGGHDILEARNGISGLRKIKVERPDIVVTDVMMPLMDGYGLRDALLSCPEACFTPIVFITALPLRRLTDEEQEMLAHRVLTKPLDFDVLRSTVRAYEHGISLAYPVESHSY